MATKFFVPRADNEGQLGTTNKRWSKVYAVEIHGDNLGAGATAGDTDGLPEGTTNLYFVESRVLATILDGLSVGTAAVIESDDSLLEALAKLQAQITAGVATTVPWSGVSGTPTTLLGYGITDAINVSVLDTDVTLLADSDTKIASQHAIKTYVDSRMPGVVAAYIFGGDF